MKMRFLIKTFEREQSREMYAETHMLNKMGTSL